MKFVVLEKGRPDMKLIPNDCPKEVLLSKNFIKKKLNELMIKSWDQNPDMRPSFIQILYYFKNMSTGSK